jgi:hypothetical protein
MLQPSVTRRESGTLPEYHECLEVAAFHKYGTLRSEQYEFIETFGAFPPESSDIELNVSGALRDMAEYDQASHGDSDNDIWDFLPGAAA